jgi:hypothetical protein
MGCDALRCLLDQLRTLAQERISLDLNVTHRHAMEALTTPPHLILTSLIAACLARTCWNACEGRDRLLLAITIAPAWFVVVRPALAL